MGYNERIKVLQNSSRRNHRHRAIFGDAPAQQKSSGLLQAQKSMQANACWELSAERKASTMEQVRAKQVAAAEQQAAEQECKKQLALQQAAEEAARAEAMLSSQVVSPLRAMHLHTGHIKQAAT